MDKNSYNPLNCGCLIAAAIIIFLFVLMGTPACSGNTSNEYLTEDGKRKCDICNKPAEYVLDGDHFCREHFDWAVNYYLGIDE